MDLRFTIQATIISIVMTIGMMLFVIATSTMAQAAFEQNFVDDGGGSGAGVIALLWFAGWGIWYAIKKADHDDQHRG